MSLKKLKLIVQGWANYAFENYKIEQRANERAIICSVCEYARNDVWFDLKDSRIQEISGIACFACECPLSTKLRSDDKCPLGKWE